ncbi:hypothetical protein [Microvirga brassicacearum]|uniref:Uncharacterized protein n=1 Tax=Microvirga brassicacearum TaxID=2580413 RepID=A0A5N3PJ48_9HYPH|nr:hypothetical protein [Microvirga brassicacearum]KAB0269703.1 hypothetical protein FEZ63_00050 [Microvirga brassicacearum]
MRTTASPSYAVLFLIAALLAGGLAFSVQWGIRSSACRPFSKPGTYLAFCSTARYGDYEHGAYFLGYESEAVDNLRKADVLLLGNSRAQFAFSTDSVETYFGARGLRYHLLGFGYNETSEFPVQLIERYGLRPRALVINADRFFAEWLSPPAKAVSSGSLAVRAEHVGKKIGPWIADHACAFGPIGCTRNSPTIYRSHATGRWIWANLLATPQQRATNLGIQQIKASDADIEGIAQVAESFLKRIGISRECLVLTAAPNDFDETKTLVQRLGARLRWPVIYPIVEDLATIDGSHLNEPSAERWSAAVVAELEGALGDCASINWVDQQKIGLTEVAP